MPKPLLGAHVSFKTPHYLFGSVTEALSYQANTCMIYLGAPQNTARVDPSKYQLAPYQASLATKIPPELIVVHAPYIVNPAAPLKAAFAVEFISAEIARMNTFGARWLVLHPGAATSNEKSVALTTLVTTLRQIIQHTTNVVILLETMAGKGTELGANFEELAWVLSEVNSPRIGLCLDTCHLWDAGYDVRDDWNGVVAALDKLNLRSYVKVIHLNDSRNARGSHKDRHANIGAGQIGLAALREILHDARFAEVPKILETPYVDDKPPYAGEIALLLA